MSPIYGAQLENISITGEGVLDGAGEAWRMVKKSKLTEGEWKKRVASMSGPVILIRDCREVTIDKSKAGNASVFLRVEGEKSQNIRITATDLAICKPDR